MNIDKIVLLLKENNLLIKSNVLDMNFNYLSYNSNDVEPNTLFICKGVNFKKEYLEESIKKGVICYISENILIDNFPYIIVKDIRKSMGLVSKMFYNIESKKINIIGVTGTKGKTTTVNFIKNMFEEEEHKRAVYMSTIDYFTGRNYGKSHNTTLESVDIYRCIRDAKELDYKYLTLEVSSQATKLDRIYKIDFDIGVFTNIDLDHISLNEHKDFNEYLECKIGFLRQCKTVIIFNETNNFDEIVNKLSDKKIITYGYKNADYVIKDIKKDKNSTIFSIEHNNEVLTYKINITGDFNALNACASVVVGDQYNIDYKTKLKGLIKTIVPGRMNIFEGKTTLVVDYAHNKLSLNELLKTIKKDYKDKNIKLVFGCPGDKAVNRRKELADLSNEYATMVYITTEDPGMKNPLDISEEISSYLNIDYKIVLDREKAIKEAYNDSNKNDIVLVLGKGEETYQLVNGVYEYYKSDTEVAKELVKKIININ